MSNKPFILFFFLFLNVQVYSQNEVRLNSLQNKLEILKIDYPEFEEKVNVNISHTNLSNLLLAISKVHGININVSPELEKIDIINNFSNVSIADLLIFLAKEYELEIDLTGNILSISKFHPPVTIPEEKEIGIEYEPGPDLISLDLQSIPLDRAFRTITDVTGRNLVFAPGMEGLPLNVYLSRVPFDAAMEQLAISNNLVMTKSRDGFYIFDRLGMDAEGQVSQTVKRRSNLDYTVLDPYSKLLEVNIEDIPAEDLINALAEDLDLNIFTAAPLSGLGNISVKAEEILLDDLLDKIFESINLSSRNPASGMNSVDPAIRGYSGDIDPGGVAPYFTYKKEDDLYFFGTEDQLALKEVEVIPMMHRSIEMLTTPVGSYGRDRIERSTTIPGSPTYFPGNTAFNQSPLANTGGVNRDLPIAPPQTITESIKKLVPTELLEGIEVKIDIELNSFIVAGPAARVARFKDFILYIDKPVPVILIEVMILEVNQSAIVETGVSFGLAEEPVSTEGRVFPSTDLRLGASSINRIIGGFDGFGSFNIGKVVPEFYMNIKAMEANGNLKILSTPKLSTLNGHKAHLASGETTYYAVTSQSFYGSQIPQTSEITNYYPIDAELALEILPFVAGDGVITLDINVIQSSFNGERIAEDAPPGMNSREFSSIIRMRDQDVAILGGIEERTKDDSGVGVPLLARIPVLKWLFSQRVRQDSKKNLSVLIKPTIIY